MFFIILNIFAISRGFLKKYSLQLFFVRFA
jgi:hypothetical protein